MTEVVKYYDDHFHAYNHGIDIGTSYEEVIAPKRISHYEEGSFSQRNESASYKTTLMILLSDLDAPGAYDTTPGDWGPLIDGVGNSEFELAAGDTKGLARRIRIRGKWMMVVAKSENADFGEEFSIDLRMYQKRPR